MHISFVGERLSILLFMCCDSVNARRLRCNEITNNLPLEKVPLPALFGGVVIDKACILY